MDERGFSARIGVAAALSVLLHAGGLVALGGDWLNTGSAPPPVSRDRVPLGIRDSNAATITWIGFEAPTEHQARESTVEQAAQTAGGGTPGAPGAIRELVTKQAESTTRAAAAALDAVVRALQEVDLTIAEDAPAERVEPQPAEASRGAPQQAEPAPKPGDAEREADAVSLEKPVKIQWGKPIAAEGLEILTTRKGPDFSAYTSVTARPKPLFVEISFGPEGPQQVTRVEKIGSSGNPDIDRPYINVIYRWRARGERIEALGPGEVVKVRLRIIVHL